MKLDGVVAFVAVAETGSISDAARRLRLAKSVVSERLAELERSLGATLIHRTTRKLALTPDGLSFLERARRISGEAADAADELAARRGVMSGPLRINAPYSLTNMHLGPALYSFLAKHPDINLTLELEDRFVDPSAAGFDAVFRIAPELDTHIPVQPITTSRRVLVASPAYIAANGAPRSLAELEQHRAVHFTDRSPDDWVFHDGARSIAARVAPNVRINGCESVRDAVIAGMGVGFLPTFICGPALKSGALVAIDVGMQPDINHIFAVLPGDFRPKAKLRALIDHVRDAFGSPPYWEAGLDLPWLKQTVAAK